MADVFLKLRCIFLKKLVDGLVYYNAVKQDVIVNVF